MKDLNPSKIYWLWILSYLFFIAILIVFQIISYSHLISQWFSISILKKVEFHFSWNSGIYFLISSSVTSVHKL